MNSDKLKKLMRMKTATTTRFSKITDALTVAMNRINAVEKLIRPPSKILVKESVASDLTPTTTLTSAETTISAVTQCTINKGVRMIVRDKTYLMVKFLDNDQMATRIIILSLDTGYVQ